MLGHWHSPIEAGTLVLLRMASNASDAAQWMLSATALHRSEAGTTPNSVRFRRYGQKPRMADGRPGAFGRRPPSGIAPGRDGGTASATHGGGLRADACRREHSLPCRTR